MEETEKQMFSLDELKQIIKEELREKLSIRLNYNGDKDIDVELLYEFDVIASDGICLYGIAPNTNY